MLQDYLDFDFETIRQSKQPGAQERWWQGVRDLFYSGFFVAVSRSTLDIEPEVSNGLFLVLRIAIAHISIIICQDELINANAAANKFKDSLSMLKGGRILNEDFVHRGN